MSKSQMVTSQFVEIAQQYVKSGALNQCFKQLLGQQMTGFLQPQPIIIDDFIKIEENVQSQGQEQTKHTKKEKKQAKSQRKIKIVHNEKDNFSQKEEQKSQEIKQKKKQTRQQLQKEIDKTQLSETRNKKQAKRPLSNYNVYFRERNKSMKNFTFQDKAVMIAKEWSQMSAEQKGLYSDKPNIDLSLILNQTKEINKQQKQDEMIPATERNEQKGERLIANHIKSEYFEPQNLCYRYEPDKQFI